MSLPAVSPDVTADAVAALPTRLRARLDTTIAQVPSWPTESTSDGVRVAVDDQTTVTLKDPVRAAADAVCSCLLTPRCLHRTAILCAAPILDDAAEVVRGDGSSGAGQLAQAAVARGQHEAVQAFDGTAAVPGDRSIDVGRPAQVAVTEGQREAAQALWHAASVLLEHGLAGAGAITQAGLLRAVHQARAVGLPRPAAAATGVVRLVRAALDSETFYRLADLTDSVRDLLLTCHIIFSGYGDQAAAMGVARRDYEPVGDLRLHGLFCEPVRTPSGLVGAVTYLADAQSKVWTVNTTQLGETAQSPRAAHASVEIGDVRASHHDLSRAGLLVANAHASADGRLSHGRKVQAVRSASAGWPDSPWAPTAGEQARRWLDTLELPLHERPGGHDLAYLDGVIAGSDQSGLLLALADESCVVAVSAPLDDPSLPYVTNLRMLAQHSSGRRLRLIGRFAGARRVHGLAFTADWLHTRFRGHADLGVDVLQQADLPGPDPIALPANVPASLPPLHLVRHTTERVVSGGRTVLLAGVANDTRRLTAAQMTTSAALLEALAATGKNRTRDLFGRLNPNDTHELALAWLSLASYEQAATKAAILLSWSQPSITLSLPTAQRSDQQRTS